ncbi:hypothetical protein [Rhodopirellula sallentina]|uniref:hypothetical protein n=1 Tax=Rhodopirellula sallentina TaxID=1263869 RepID=UPI001F1EA36C|nr:hypothetical protein [Rhodopirellula sallentina]
MQIVLACLYPLGVDASGFQIVDVVGDVIGKADVLIIRDLGITIGQATASDVLRSLRPGPQDFGRVLFLRAAGRLVNGVAVRVPVSRDPVWRLHQNATVAALGGLDTSGSRFRLAVAFDFPAGKLGCLTIDRFGEDFRVCWNRSRYRLAKQRRHDDSTPIG